MWAAARVTTVGSVGTRTVGRSSALRRGVAGVTHARPVAIAPRASVARGDVPSAPRPSKGFAALAASASGDGKRAVFSNFGARRGLMTRAAEGGGGGGGGAGGGGGGGGGSGGGGDGGSGGGGLWALYLGLLESNPLATKCFTSGILNAAGDLFAQFMFENAAEKGTDWRRAGVFTFLGAVLVGPALHLWYGSLSKIVAATGATGTAAAGVSLALDQLAFAPCFLAVFIASLFTIEGNADAVVPKLKQDWGTTVVNNWKVWVPFQFLNFRFVPVNLQVGAANVIALAWNTYMSYVSHLAVKEPEPVPAKGKGKK